jgi:prepilin-type N-terminal cleavage/methylation domain-containing protein
MADPILHDCLRTAGSKDMGCGAKEHRRALTLVELMVAVAIIAVAVIGAMGFRFYCVTDAKKADVQVNAARIASMILENWKGMGGEKSYNPKTQFGSFTSQFTITPDQQVGASTMYQIQDKTNQVWYDAILSFTEKTLPEPNELSISISWRQGYGKTGTMAHTIGITEYAE